MALSRAYTPSAALLRALSRTQPLPCPFVRPLPTQFVRGKKTKAAKARDAEKAQMAYRARKDRRAQQTEEKTAAELEEEAEEQFKKDLKDEKFAAAAKPLMNLIAEMKDPTKIDKYFELPADEDFKEGEDPDIHFYEMDLHTGKQRKVNRFGTLADLRREREMRSMIEQSFEDPNYDDAELNKRLMDGLISDPAFADLTEELKEIKESILTKEEIKQIEEEAERDAQPAIEEMNATMRMAIHEAVTELVNDPDIGDAKPDLQAILDKMPEIEDIQSRELQALLDKATEKVNKNPKIQAKLKAGSENETEQDRQRWANFEKDIEDLLAPEEDHRDEYGMPLLSDKEVSEELNDLLRQMRDILKTTNVSSELGSEIDRMIAEPIPNLTDDDEDTDAAKLAADLTKFAASKSKTIPAPEAEEDAEEDNEEHIPPEIRAKVDKIMEDPRLMEKLVYIQKLIAEQPKRDPNDLTQIDHELAPDPYELEDSRTATLAQRMAAARADPEHSAALRRLRVKLQPPFNIAPALKSFNQVLEFAYIGANDDVRRVLWRSYQKARTLPTFLQNMNDDAWDILYYSQAVTWTGNQNRTDHLRMLLRDLAKVGRNGPPTHPSTLGQHAEAARLEAAQREASRLDA